MKKVVIAGSVKLQKEVDNWLISLKNSYTRKQLTIHS